MDEGNEKKIGREGEHKQEEETKEHLALVAKSKSDNRMTKLSTHEMLSWWVCSFSLSLSLLCKEDIAPKK